MSEPYAREILRRNVAQICQTIGWNGINSTPLDILAHVLEKYIRTLGTQTNRYAEQFNRTEPNLNDLGLVFNDINFRLPELAEYTQSVPPVPAPVNVQKFPKPKESNLNFLKPGSHEVVTRPVHVHEHLPPMYPEKEQDTPTVADTVEIHQNGINNGTGRESPEIMVTDSPEKPKDLFKRPNDPIPLLNSKRPRLRCEEEERTREISSVIMTMSGFISPAREGKLPEAKAPVIISEKHLDKNKVNSHSNVKIPALQKVDKKSKKNKLLNGKIMKNKRKDKSHKEVSGKSKTSKLKRHPPGISLNKNLDFLHRNNVVVPGQNIIRPSMPPPSIPLPITEPVRPIVKQEPIDPPPTIFKNKLEAEIPVPRKIPISRSPLLMNASNLHKQPSSSMSFMPETNIKKEVVEEEEKLASQPDRSKIDIFKRISNKSKDEKSTPEVVFDKYNSDTVSRIANSSSDRDVYRPHQSIGKLGQSVITNNNEAVDLSVAMDLTSNEVIGIDDDSIEYTGIFSNQLNDQPRPTLSINKSLQVPFPKNFTPAGVKVKKEKKHKDKKDKAAEKAAKLTAKLLKKQQQQLAFEMAQAEKFKIGEPKPKKSNKLKNQKHPRPPVSQNFSFFPEIPHRGILPGPGLIPNPGLIPGGDFYHNLTNNPALRGMQGHSLANPFALTSSGPGLIPGSNFLQSALNPNSNPHMFAHTSQSHKLPTMLRRPSLEVIPVNNDDRGSIKPLLLAPDKVRPEKHKTIPNLLQKHKSKSHREHKSNVYKLPPVQPDITIELNPPKVDTQQYAPSNNDIPQVPLPIPEHSFQEQNPPLAVDITKESDSKLGLVDKIEKKKDKSHKKDRKDKDLKIKKKKDKKDKNRDKIDKKREKDEKIEIKEKIKKEKKDKKKDKTHPDGVVPKLTLKLSSSNSNSPMPPSSPDIFKLNIKPIIKKEEPESPTKEQSVSREHSRSPELAQISALVTRPPKQKHSKHNHISEEVPASPPSSTSSPTRKNRPPSSHSKYKRILFKPLSQKDQPEDLEDTMTEEEIQARTVPSDQLSGTLPTPFYVDEQGNKVWVCPACGRPDNGSPMIGCDGCDGWYHWVCVGITEEPGATEDWFCKSCVAKRAAMVLAGMPSKKRGRKPKGERVRESH